MAFSATPSAKLTIPSLALALNSNALSFTPEAKLRIPSLALAPNSNALSFTPEAKSAILLPTSNALSFTLLPISLALSQVLLAKVVIPCLNLELGSENTLNPSAITPTAPPTAPPIAVPTPGIIEPIAAPTIAPLAPDAAIPIASSPALPSSIPTYLLNEEPLLAFPVKAPSTPASTVPMSSRIPCSFFCSAVRSLT